MNDARRDGLLSYKSAILVVAVGSRLRRVLFGTVFAATLVSVGCGTSESERDLTAARKKILASFDGIAEAETLSLRARLEQAIRDGDSSLVAENFDLAVYVLSVAELQKSGEAEFDALREDLEAKRDRFVGATLQFAIDSVKAGGEYQFVRSGERDGRTVAIYRIMRADGDLHYQEWAFVRDEDSQVRIGDLYNYAIGEWNSQTISRSTAAMGRVEGDGANGRFREQYRLAGELTKARNSAELDRLVSEFPPDMRDDKQVLLLQIAAATGDAERYRFHYERLAEKFPDDTATSLLKYAIRSADGRHEGAIAALRDLDRHIGGDPMLAAFQGNEWLSAKRADKAEAAYRTAIQGDPTLLEPYFGMMYVAAAREDFENAVDWARAYGSATNSPPISLSRLSDEDFDEVWRALRRSEEWRAFEEEQKQVRSIPSP